MSNPRDNPEDAQREFESMDDDAWRMLWESPGVPHGLTLAEQEGLAAAIATRVKRKQEVVSAFDKLFERADSSE